MGVPEIFEYDGIVLHSNATFDRDFVDTLCEKLESGSDRVRLLVPNRDLPETSRDLESIHEFIDRKCRRCLVIISESSVEDPLFMANVKYANSITAGHTVSKIIPILIQKCDVPKLLRSLTLCNFTKTDIIPWLWSTLKRSVMMQSRPDQAMRISRTKLEARSEKTSNRKKPCSLTSVFSGGFLEEEKRKKKVSSIFRDSPLE